MRTSGIAFALMLWSAGVAFAQQPFVIHDMSAAEISAAIAAGKTTCLLSLGGSHHRFMPPDEFQGPEKDPVPVGYHDKVAAYVGQRVASIVGNILVWDVPYWANMNSKAAGDAMLRAVVRDVVTDAIATGCKLVALIQEHDAGRLSLLKKLPDEWNPEFSAKGARFEYIPVFVESKVESVAYISSLKGVPEACVQKDVQEWVRKYPDASRNTCQQQVVDISEMAFLDNGKWLRKANVPASLVKFVTPEIGKVFLDQKINITVKHLRAMQSASTR